MRLFKKNKTYHIISDLYQNGWKAAYCGQMSRDSDLFEGEDTETICKNCMRAVNKRQAGKVNA